MKMRQRKCVFCKEPIVGYGNSVRPLRDGKGECCDECNGKIMIPYRMMMAARSIESRATEDAGGRALMKSQN